MSKRSSLMQFLLNGGIYTVSSILNRAVPFLLLPVLTRYLSPTDYGYTALFNAFVLFLMPITGWCANTVLVQKYFRLDEVQRTNSLAATYQLILITSVILGVLFYAVAPWLQQVVQMPLLWIELGVVTAALGMIGTVMTSLLRIEKQAVRFGAVQMVQTLTNLGLSLLFVIPLHMAWQGRLVAMLLANLVVVGLTVLYHRNTHQELAVLRPRRHDVVSQFQLGAALLPTALIAWGLALGDRAIMTTLSGLEMVGIYSVAAMVAQIVDVLTDAVGNAYQPFFFERVARAGKGRDDITLARSLYGLAAFFLFIPLVITVAAPLLMSWFIDARFHSALQAIGWLAFASAIMAIGRLFYNFLLDLQRNWLISGITAFVCAVNLGGNYLMIPQFGFMGAAYAALLSSVCFVVAMFTCAVMFGSLPPPWRLFSRGHDH